MICIAAQEIMCGPMVTSIVVNGKIIRDVEKGSFIGN